MKKANFPRIDRLIYGSRKDNGNSVRSYGRIFSMMLLVMTLFCSGLSAVAQTTYYVNADAAPGGDGLTWATAYTNLHDPLFVAQHGDQIWVAAGIYRPTTNPENRDVAFRLKSGVAVYGGFVGNETGLSQRDWVANLTILSGDIEGDDQGDVNGIITNPLAQITGSNSYHVVVASDDNSPIPADNNTVLDGFTITGGDANGPDNASQRGGAIFNLNGSPVLRNLDIVGNRAFTQGGGIHSAGIIANVTLTAVKIRHNVITAASGGGGGLFNGADGTITITNSEIMHNAGDYGGGIQTWDRSVNTLINVLIYDNHATLAAGTGGGIRSGGSTLSLINVTISGNTAGLRGGGLESHPRSSVNTNPVVINSIIWGNFLSNGNVDEISVQNDANGIIAGGGSKNNLIGGSADLHGNSNVPIVPPGLLAEQIFVNPALGDYRLSQASPANNVGDNASFPASAGTLDLDGNPRIYNGGIIDLGPYEYQGTAVPVVIPTVMYVKQDAAGDGSGSSWENAFTELSTALAWAKDNWVPVTGHLELWVAEGVYKPTASTTDREAAFELLNDVHVYGGFAGNEEFLYNRDYVSNITVLSGDIDGNDTGTDNIITDPTVQISGGNSYNVVVSSGTDNTAVLDGLTITGGSADAATGGTVSRQQSGGGIYNNAGSPLLRNLDITGNRAVLRGGGIHNFGGAQPTLIGVKVRNNHATDPTDGFGGGVFSADVNTHLTLTNTEIDNNTAAQGGGLHSTGQTLNTLTNVVVSDNRAVHAVGRGGGIRSEGSTFYLYNATIGGNTAASGAGISNESQGTYHSQPVVTNSIIWGNGSVGGANNIFNANASNGINVGNSNSSHNLIEGEDHGASNIADIPENLSTADIYRNPANGDYRPKAGTPTWNAGDNSLYPDLDAASVDMEGNPRVYDLDNGGIIDLGAYEFQGVPMGPGTNNVLYVNKHVGGGAEIGNNWTNAIPELSTALTWAGANWNPAIDGILEIWVAQGAYTPVQPVNTDNVTVTERGISFQLVSGVEIYGGFAGTETGLSQRDWESNLTILSGDLGGDDTETVITDPYGTDGTDGQIQGSNNTFQLVNGSGVDNTAVLDGFTITGASDQGNTSGRAGAGITVSGGSPVFRNLDVVGNLIRWRGAGVAIMSGAADSEIWSNVVMSNSKIRHNVNTTGSQGYGVGVFLQHANTNVEFTDMEILNNRGLLGASGGGMWVYNGASYTLNRAVIRGNTLETGSGAGLYNQELNAVVGGSATLTNVLIVDNHITGASGNRRGSGMLNTQSNPILNNVVMTGNTTTGTQGAGMSNLTASGRSSNPIVTNSILWGNGAPAQNIWNQSGGNNLDVDGSAANLIEGPNHVATNVPGVEIGMTVDDIFLDPANGDYRLLTGAPGINTGSNVKLWEAIQLRDGHSNPMPAPGDAAWGTDLAGGPRILDDVVDLGVYEWTQPTTPTMRLFWNGDPVLDNTLEISYGDQGELTVTSEGDATPVISANPALLSLSASESPSQATALAIGTGQIALFSPATDTFDETTHHVDLVISPKELIVKADTLTKEFGASDPVLTYTVEGLAFDDQATDVLTGELAREPGEDKTIYVIEQGTLAVVTGNPNYTISFVEGEFEITGFLQQITLTAPYEEVEMVVGRVPLTAFSSSGLPVILSVDDPTVATLTATDLILRAPGTVTIRATQGGDDTWHPAEPVEITVLVLENFVHVNRGVSPDGDGINDFFRIDRIENFPDNVVTIFDRTGKVIEQITGYDNNQRVFTGESLRSGTYYYRLNITVHGERRSYKGSFELKSRD